MLVVQTAPNILPLRVHKPALEEQRCFPFPSVSVELTELCSVDLMCGLLFQELGVPPDISRTELCALSPATQQFVLNC